MKLTEEIIDILETSTGDERAYFTAKYFFAYAIAYYSQYFTHPFAPFHEDLFQDFEDLVYGRARNAAWVIFRAGAKTSIAKIGLSWIIARQSVINKLRSQGENVDHWGERRYINVDSYDKENAESLLFDVVLDLQTNERLINDFGHVYNKARTKNEAQMKRVSNFVTPDGIRVEAHTAMTPMRGRLYNRFRPDFVLRDDIENKITIASPTITDKIINLLDEAKGGMAQHGVSLTLGNYISENGSIGYVLKSVRESKGRVRFIPIVDSDGNIAWPAKYVETDEEAAKLNRTITDPARRKVSLQGLRRELNAGGRRVYEEDMLLDPAAAGNLFFDREKIDELINAANKRNKKNPPTIRGNKHVYKTYRASDTYAFGGDTAKGNGGDSNTYVGFDFTPIPAQQVASFADNMISPDLYSHELAQVGHEFGTCLLAPEKNTESGGIVLTTLRMIYPNKMIYQQVPFDKVREKPTGELGWETNSATKYQILIDFRTAVEQGLVAINDVRILKEARVFTYSDADRLGKSKLGLSTNHFDLLMAAAIGWAMRKHARPKEFETDNNDYQQEEYEDPGL